jgi:uncharacterized membrane protein
MGNGVGKALLIGVVAGMRAFLAPAVVSATTESETCQTRACTLTNSALTVLSAGEFIADKTPLVWDRIAFLPLAGRVASGAICGSIVSRRSGDSPLIGAVVGGAAAYASAHACYLTRTKLAEATGAPDAILAIAEDALASALAVKAVS